MLHKAMQNKGARIAIAVFATFLYALGVNLFIVPVGLYSGGMVGLSQVIRTVLTERVALPAGVDIAGILYFLLNVPMLIIGWKELGHGFLAFAWPYAAWILLLGFLPRERGVIRFSPRSRGGEACQIEL